MIYPWLILDRIIFQVFKNGRVRIFFYNHSNVYAWTSPKTINPYKWHYFAISHDGETARVFIDGELVIQKEGLTVPSDYFSDRDFVIGYRTSHAYKGYIDDLMLVNKAFNGKEFK